MGLMVALSLSPALPGIAPEAITAAAGETAGCGGDGFGTLLAALQGGGGNSGGDPLGDALAAFFDAPVAEDGPKTPAGANGDDQVLMAALVALQLGAAPALPTVTLPAAADARAVEATPATVASLAPSAGSASITPPTASLRVQLDLPAGSTPGEPDATAPVASEAAPAAPATPPIPATATVIEAQASATAAPAASVAAAPPADTRPVASESAPAAPATQPIPATAAVIEAQASATAAPVASVEAAPLADTAATERKTVSQLRDAIEALAGFAHRTSRAAAPPFDHKAEAGNDDTASDTPQGPPQPPPGPSHVTAAEFASVVRIDGNAPNGPAANVAASDDSAPTDAAAALQAVSQPTQAHAQVTDAAAVATTPEVRTPESVQPFEQVARAVINRANEGGGEARLHLRPAELGDVTIRVHAHQGDVRVEIQADRPEALQILKDHTNDLSSLLGERGLNLRDVYVGLGNRNGQPGETAQQREQRQDGGEDFAAILGVDEVPAANQYNRLRAAYNPDGAHVYRI